MEETAASAVLVTSGLKEDKNWTNLALQLQYSCRQDTPTSVIKSYVDRLAISHEYTSSVTELSVCRTSISMIHQTE